MIKFGFYGRVSTEDQQDPESSRAWQLTRSRALIEPRGGVIVAKFFDIDKSRSIPWQRRPEAAALLAELKRDFSSVKHIKPPASRSDSAELYLLARGFRRRAGGGGAANDES